MSYILDALRRADAERDRGDVPHLHTQAVPAGEMDAERAPSARPWLWLASGLAIGLLVALAWVIGGRAPTDGAPSAAAPQAIAPSPAAPTPAATAARTAADDAPAAAEAPPSIVPRSLVPAPSPVAPRVTAAPSLSPAAVEARSRPTAAASASPPGSPREAAITQLAELPEDVRRELPRLTIGGSMYSEKPASRMLIVNGQLLREGDKVSPTVTLQQIRLRSAVLTYKTYRYEIGF